MDMTIKEFGEKICELINERVKMVTPSIVDVQKENNVKLVGINLKRKDSNIAPVIYINSMYEKDYTVEEAYVQIMTIYSNSNINSDEIGIDLSRLGEFEYIKDRILPKVINKDSNVDFANDFACIEAGDMYISFYIYISSIKGEAASIKVKKEFVDMWNVDEKDLIAVAFENLKAIKPLTVEPISNIVTKIAIKNGFNIDEIGLPPIDDEVMYVGTVENGINGAVYMLSEDTLNEISEKLGGANKYYILPSSIHEFIVVNPSSIENDDNELLNMVKEVNSTQLEPEEVLTDNVYVYEKLGDNGVCTLKDANGNIMPLF